MKQISAEATQDRLTVSVQLLNLAEGIYAFLVRSSLPAKASVDDNLLLPAVHVARGPDVGGGEIEFMTGPRGRATWLRDSADVVMARVTGEPVTVLLTSLRVSGAPALALEIQRVDGRSVLGPPAVTAGEDDASGTEAHDGIASKITAHVQTRGDMPFVGVAWAGLVGQRLWIESFAVEPEAPLGEGRHRVQGPDRHRLRDALARRRQFLRHARHGHPADRLLRADQALPVGAIRLQNTAAASCRARPSAPSRNGAPCRSPMPDDPLEAIQLRILERQAPDEELKQPAAPAKPPAPSRRAAAATKSEPAAEGPAAKPSDVWSRPAHGEAEAARA